MTNLESSGIVHLMSREFRATRDLSPGINRQAGQPPTEANASKGRREGQDALLFRPSVRFQRFSPGINQGHQVHGLVLEILPVFTGPLPGLIFGATRMLPLVVLLHDPSGKGTDGTVQLFG